MLFNSYEFLLFFLPAVLAGYFLLGTRGNAFLVAASLFFYAYWRAEFLWLLLASIAVNFLVGTTILRRRAAGRSTKAVLVAGVAFDLLLLGYFKYANFFAANVAALLGIQAPSLAVILPIGISFFTFTQIAFLVDAHAGKAREPSLVSYALFVTYFPHLLAGPILHHREMMPQFADASSKRVDWENVARGLTLLAIGLGKKVLIADALSPWVAETFAPGRALSFADAWLAALAYTMQIYFDFSGYTDMALGMALMMNIRLPQNFDSPYRRRNLREFWRHWHMTLMRFLRDYVYIPLGGNRRGEAFTAFALVATFALGGLWHGAAWTFVLWGVANGVGLVVVRWWSRAGIALPFAIAWLMTAVAVMLGWVMFRAPDVATALAIMRSMAGMNGVHGVTAIAPQSVLGVLAIACVLAAMPRNSNGIAGQLRFGWPMQAAVTALLVAGVLMLGNPTEFLYFNF